MHLDGSTCSESLPYQTCHFETPEHVPRTTAQGLHLDAGSGQAPCVPRSREHEERPVAVTGKSTEGQNNTFIRAKRVSNCYMQEKKNWQFVCISG